MCCKCHVVACVRVQRKRHRDFKWRRNDDKAIIEAVQKFGAVFQAWCVRARRCRGGARVHRPALTLTCVAAVGNRSQLEQQLDRPWDCIRDRHVYLLQHLARTAPPL